MTNSEKLVELLARANGTPVTRELLKSQLCSGGSTLHRLIAESDERIIRIQRDGVVAYRLAEPERRPPRWDLAL